MRIYSQKQLFALAQDPNALLTVIDDSQVVVKAELDRPNRPVGGTLPVTARRSSHGVPTGGRPAGTQGVARGRSATSWKFWSAADRRRS